MRNIREVIAQMLAIIPETEVNFKARLIKLSNDSTYQPPESNLYWHKVAWALSEFIPNIPKEEWQWCVCGIFTTKTVETLKQENKE